VNPYQSPAETVTPALHVADEHDSLLLWRSVMASSCFLLGSVSLALALCWLVAGIEAAIQRTGSVGPWFIFSISGFAAAIGTALLIAGFSATNRRDERMKCSMVAAISLLALGLMFVALQ
jgi:hypothetical protein